MFGKDQHVRLPQFSGLVKIGSRDEFWLAEDG